MSITLQNDSDKTSYCLGMDIGMSFKKLPVTINLEAAIAGISDVFQNVKPQVGQQEFMELMQKFQQTLRTAAEKQARKTRNRKRNSSQKTRKIKTSSSPAPDSSTKS